MSIQFCVTHHDNEIAKGCVNEGEKAAVTVAMPATGHFRLLEFDIEVADFRQSGLAEARYTIDLCETVVKFGAPLQFTEKFSVRCWWEK